MMRFSLACALMAGASGIAFVRRLEAHAFGPSYDLSAADCFPSQDMAQEVGSCLLLGALVDFLGIATEHSGNCCAYPLLTCSVFRIMSRALCIPTRQHPLTAGEIKAALRFEQVGS